MNLPASAAQPLVSIVTPVRNSITWLPACRESIVAQSYGRVEHIVIDAGSNDGTPELLATWPNVTWVSEPDRGQSHALNKGFARARGEILGWLNADDRLMPDALERVVDALAQPSMPGWIVGAAEFREGGSSRVAHPGRISLKSLDLRNPIVQPACLFTRPLWDLVGGEVDESLHLAMDLDLWLRFLRAGVDPVVRNEVLALVNVHPEAKTRSVNAGDWYFEMGLARAKNGRLSAAGVEFGRSVAEREPLGADRMHLSRLTNSLRAQLAERGISAPPTAIRAGALVQWATQEARLSRKLLRVCRPEPWMVRATRSELRTAALRRGRRLLGGG